MLKSEIWNEYLNENVNIMRLHNNEYLFGIYIWRFCYRDFTKAITFKKCIIYIVIKLNTVWV